MSVNELIKLWNITDKTSDGLYFITIKYDSLEWKQYKTWVKKAINKKVNLIGVMIQYDMSYEIENDEIVVLDFYKRMTDISSLFGVCHYKATIHPSKNDIIHMTDSIQTSSLSSLEKIPKNDYICNISFHWPRLAIDVQINKK